MPQLGCLPSIEPSVRRGVLHIAGYHVMPVLNALIRQRLDCVLGYTFREIEARFGSR